jgi:hypothetical protein
MDEVYMPKTLSVEVPENTRPDLIITEKYDANGQLTHRLFPEKRLVGTYRDGKLANVTRVPTAAIPPTPQLALRPQPILICSFQFQPKHLLAKPSEKPAQQKNPRK